MKTNKIEVAVAFGLITLMIGTVIYNSIVYGIETAPY
jgi:hypothetical protein